MDKLSILPIRLICFPYGGGSSTLFFRWKNLLPKEIILESIEYSGHGKYFQKPLIYDFNSMIDHLRTELEGKMEFPFAFFGHSMGALLSFELTRRLQDYSLPLPKHLFVSGCRAPQISRGSSPISELSDEDFYLSIQKRFHSIPSEISQNPELLKIFLSILKADYAVMENYHYVVKPAIDCPITALSGDTDPVVSNEQLDDWRFHTSSRFNKISIPGDHFSIISDPKELIKEIVKGIQQQ